LPLLAKGLLSLIFRIISREVYFGYKKTPPRRTCGVCKDYNPIFLGKCQGLDSNKGISFEKFVTISARISGSVRRLSTKVHYFHIINRFFVWCGRAAVMRDVRQERALIVVGMGPKKGPETLISGQTAVIEGV
jgi:hypothetical protein